MKRFIIIVAVVVLIYIVIRACTGGGGTKINGYQSSVKSVEGNTLTLVSGVKARLLGVEDNRTDVEMFLRAQFLNKRVTLYADSHDNVQKFKSTKDVVKVYVVETDKRGYCINRQVVNEYPDCYRRIETKDSTDWILPDAPLIEKKDLALYMKQRTFLVQTPTGIGTGFFISEDGLAITNWHVLSPKEEKAAIAILYENNPDDSGVYSDKKRNFKNIRWCQDTDGLDITIMSVDLENGEKVPYFNIAKRRPNQGDKVATYGNPKGLTASYTSGDVSAYRLDSRPKDNVMLMQYNMPTNGGNSGGPVCDKYGQIVAVHELGDKSAQGINYGIDVMQIRVILDGLGLKYGGK